MESMLPPAACHANVPIVVAEDLEGLVTGEASIQCLPDEMLERTLCWAGGRAATRASAVCRRWRGLASSDEGLWRILYEAEFGPLRLQLSRPTEGGWLLAYKCAVLRCACRSLEWSAVPLVSDCPLPREGSNGCFSPIGGGCLVLYGGWTWGGILEDVNVLRLVSEASAARHGSAASSAKAFRWERLGRVGEASAGERVRRPTYGHTITDVGGTATARRLLLFGGLRRSYFAGASAELHDLRLSCERPAREDDASASAPPDHFSTVSSATSGRAAARLRPLQVRQETAHDAAGAAAFSEGSELPGVSRAPQPSPLHAEWASAACPDAPTPRAYHSATYLPADGACHRSNAERLYVFGGHNEVEGCSACGLDVYDIATERWLPAAQSAMLPGGPCARFGHSAVATGGRLFVAGGCCDPNNMKHAAAESSELCHDGVWVLDLCGPSEALAWRRCAPAGLAPPHALQRCHVACAVGPKLLFFAGGRPDSLSNDVHVFDTRIEAWARAPRIRGELPTVRQNPVGALVGGRLLLFGGWGEETHGAQEYGHLHDTVCLELLQCDARDGGDEAPRGEAVEATDRGTDGRALA